MNIQPISFINFKGITQQNKITQKSYVTNPLAKDTFTKSEAFNLNNAVYTLQNIKNNKNKPKFNDYYIQTIKTQIEETPDKWAPIESLAKNPKINGEFVYLMSMQPSEKLNILKSYSEVKDKNGESKYDGKALMNFNDKADAKSLEKVLPLTETNLTPKNIIALSAEKNLPDVKKLADKIINLEKTQGNNLKDISASKDNYKFNEIIITVENKDNTSISEAYDKNFKLLYEETTTNNEKTKIQKKTTTDYRNNTVSEISARIDDYVGRPVVIEEKRTIKDHSNNIIRTEFTSPSEITGVLNVKHIDKDGNTTVLSSGSIDKKTNIASVKKNLTSLDGTKTQYLYENDPLGNRISDYIITDKTGKVLLKNSEAFEVLSDKKFISTKNDEKYEINVEDDSIHVQDLKNKERKASFKIGKELKGNSEKLLNTLKQVSGGELIKLRDNVDTLQSMDESLDSFYAGSSRTISTGDNAFLLMHEIGHAIDFKNTDSTNEEKYNASLKNTISLDKEVNELYKKEKEAFLKAFPSAQRNHIDYFINAETHQGGDYGAIGETIAETNALMNSPKNHEALSYRSQYLQQYFPQTIAKVAQKLG